MKRSDQIKLQLSQYRRALSEKIEPQTAFYIIFSDIPTDRFISSMMSNFEVNDKLDLDYLELLLDMKDTFFKDRKY